MSLLQELRDEAARRIDSREVVSRVLAELVRCEKKVIDKIVGGGKPHDSAYGQAMRPYINARQLEHRAKRTMNREMEGYSLSSRWAFDPITMAPYEVDYEAIYQKRKVAADELKQSALAKLQEL